MKKLMVLLCAMFLVFSITGVAGALRINVYDGSAGYGTWNDVNKSWSDDTLLCWAAAASNVLTWGGWDGGTSLDEEGEIFGEFRNQWPDAVGNSVYAYEWWFTGNDQTAYPPPDKDFPDNGGGFYSTTLFENNVNYEWFGPDETWLSTEIAAGHGTVLSINGYSSTLDEVYGHSITLWGIDTDLNKMWITDSDDGGPAALVEYSYDDTTMEILGYTNTYTPAFNFSIDQAITLNWNVNDIAPNLPGDGDGVIPEPGTMFLLGTGLLGLVYVLRKRKTV